MTLYRYCGDAPTSYKGKMIQPNQELELAGDDERILCKEHPMEEVTDGGGPVTFGEDTEEDEAEEADESDGEPSEVDLVQLAQAILDGDEYEDMVAFVNDHLRAEGESYIRGREKVTAKLEEFISQE